MLTSSCPIPAARRPGPHLAVAAFIALVCLVPPFTALADDKTETQSVMLDGKNKELTSSALIKLLNNKLGGVYQDLELVITSCFGGEVASRAGGATGLEGDWSVSTATDIDHTNKTLAYEVKGAGNFKIDGSTFNGWMPAWISKLAADKNTIGNKALADYAKAEKEKAIEGSTPQYSSSGKPADEMTVHGGKQSNHAILFQTTGYIKVLAGVRSALMGAGYTAPEINQVQGGGKSWDDFNAALDDLRKKLDAHPKEEKALITIETHGSKEQRTISYAPGKFGEAGGGAVVSAFSAVLPIHVDDAVVLASLGQDLAKPGGGVFSHDPDLQRFGPAMLGFSTLEEQFAEPSRVGISVNGIDIGMLGMGHVSGGDYQIEIPDSVLSAVFGDVLSTSLLNIGFDFFGGSGSFRLATSEDWLGDDYRNLDYGIGIAGNCCDATVAEPSTWWTVGLAFGLLLTFSRRKPRG